MTDSEVKNSGSSVQTLTKQLTINVGKISKILTWQGTVIFLLGSNGELNMYDIRLNSLTPISYSG